MSLLASLYMSIEISAISAHSDKLATMRNEPLCCIAKSSAMCSLLTWNKIADFLREFGFAGSRGASQADLCSREHVASYKATTDPCAPRTLADARLGMHALQPNAGRDIQLEISKLQCILLLR